MVHSPVKKRNVRTIHYEIDHPQYLQVILCGQRYGPRTYTTNNSDIVDCPKCVQKLRLMKE